MIWEDSFWRRGKGRGCSPYSLSTMSIIDAVSIPVLTPQGGGGRQAEPGASVGGVGGSGILPDSVRMASTSIRVIHGQWQMAGTMANPPGRKMP